MCSYNLYAVIVVLLGVCNATILIFFMLRKLDDTEGISESDKTIYKVQCCSYAVTCSAALVSLLVPIVKRREFFSIFAPIFVALPGVFSIVRFMGSFAEIHATVLYFTMDVGVCMQYLLFALQYLRASLTVPIYFEMSQKRFDTDSAMKLKGKGKFITRCIISSQVSLLLMECIAIVLLRLNSELNDYPSWFWPLIDYCFFCVMGITLAVTIWAGVKIRKWKVEELKPHGYRWNCKDEGLFFLFFVA